MKTEKIVLKYSLDHVPVTTDELTELDRMIQQHEKAAAERAKRGEDGVKFYNRTISDAEIAKKLIEFRDRQIALRN